MFGGLAVFHGAMVRSLWSHYPARDKLFNIGVLGLMGFLSTSCFINSYQIYMGKQMELVEFRPSYSERFRTSFAIMNGGNLKDLEDEIRMEEEKEEVRNVIKKQ